MEGFSFFAFLCVSMFFASYFVGFLPLLGNLGESKIRLVSVFGAGLLIGTAFVVVIPEGIDVINEQKFGESTNHEHLAAVLASESNAHGSIPISVNEKPPPPADTLKSSPAATGKLGARKADAHADEHAETGRLIGLLVLMGFLFMLLVDQCSKQGCGGGRRKLSTTIGLCVHALADGVLMGSASSTTNTEVQMVVFMALIVHKGPAAFALTSLLMLEKLERWRVKRHLMIFSMAAPLGAFLTYFFLAAVKEGAQQAKSMSGMFMLFSAGTFLYVAAAHVLPELENPDTHCSPAGHQVLNAPGPVGISARELLVLFVGALTPCLLFSHHHH